MVYDREAYDLTYYVDTTLTDSKYEGYIFDKSKIPLKSGLIDDYTYFQINTLTFKEAIDLLLPIFPSCIIKLDNLNNVSHTYCNLLYEDDLSFEQETIYQKVQDKFNTVEYIEGLLNEINNTDLTLRIVIGYCSIKTDYYLTIKNGIVTCYIFDYISEDGEFLYCDYKRLE
jgi:hypothetical protein